MTMRALFDDAGDPTEKYLLAVAYLGLGILGVAISLALGQSPVSMPAWLPVKASTGAWASLAMGGCLAGATLLSTRLLVAHFSWARELHGQLRPAVRGMRAPTLLAVALAGGVAEELLFRGTMMQAIGGLPGLLVSSAAFGLLHQVRGRARWIWASWATIMALLLGATFALTGSLLGPIAAHVTINAVNLRYLRAHEV